MYFYKLSFDLACPDLSTIYLMCKHFILPVEEYREYEKLWLYLLEKTFPMSF